MYKLSTLADGDIYDLTLYTIQHVGLIQAKHCHEGITKIVELQAKNPELGTQCPCFCQGMRCFQYKKHGVYFFKKGEETLISRVIHQSMDVDAQGFPG
ncbi:type II toxin-antitoxin system RelE/ParE family toxin [Serratia ureilytica]|uniref:type II toxin-antitoxin system RelE/ParE family toxin n=1 Tax=Serratia TaxID=613 RepID=UPI0018D5D4DA|nr:type II toxin-antitoxin system RelE/ParE family toxin [Serratia ureilytica]HCU0429559.1 type II toxin-antitoxin system RelE/ParE family toxin [Serratia marcescens]MBH2897974.1 type II toxin-antitoxin system RelE/ParE family toxin [Serratia ureilytica]MBN5443703.1 type II toxin-antitoxin system RelE/ParE family toxin [Serratia ureilytica]MBN5443783.1 type II toxin-antitoxin system RelE/ParE family toxin [Serratia ureilytica]MDM1845402.1 type II toxin-antitoxin system RelE/ParE family toxin [